MSKSNHNQNERNSAHAGGQGAPRKPFRLDIQFDDEGDTRPIASVTEEQHQPKGEVYFAGAPRRNPPPVAARPTPQPSGATSAPRRKKSRAPLSVTLFVVLTLAFTTLGSYVGIATVQDILALDHRSNIVHVQIPAEASTGQIIGILAKNKLIRQRTICEVYASFVFWMKGRNKKEENKPKPPVYVQGEYAVSASLGLEEMLNTFKQQSASSETVSLMFAEGFTMRQILEKIGQNRVTSESQLKQQLMSSDFSAYPFLKDLDISQRYYAFEGYLFPDTYEFFVGELPNSVLRRFFDNFNSKWTASFDAKAKELGFTVDQVLTLASIIQKEAADASQMPAISGVLHNRLGHASVYPLLECDSTRDYVYNNIQLDEGSKALYNDLYNTYKRSGLPVGPICSPGLDAIKAALNPQTNQYYYFQHDKNGKIYLSKTREQHNRVTNDLLAQGLTQ